MYVKFSGSSLKQDKIAFNHGKTVNIYIVFDLKSNLNNFDSTLKIICLEQLSLLKTVTLVNMNIQDMELDLIQKEPSHILVEQLV